MCATAWPVDADDGPPTIAPNDTLPTSYSKNPASGRFDEVWTQVSCLTVGVEASINVTALFGGTKWMSLAEIILNARRPTDEASPYRSPTVSAAVANRHGHIQAFLERRYADGRDEWLPFRTPVQIGQEVHFTISWNAEGLVSITGPGNEQLSAPIGQPVTSVALFASGVKTDFTHVTMLKATKGLSCPLS